jgi:raffinose/stachyose/melibiose transport system substrate-binding protein
MVGPIPTQPGATLDTKIGQELAPYLDNFQLGFEVIWTQPKGTGQFGQPMLVNMFQPFGTFDDPQAAAEQAQADLDSGLDAIQ